MSEKRKCVGASDVRRSPAKHGHPASEPQRSDRLLEKYAPTGHRLEQHDTAPRANDGDGDSGQASTASDVNDVRAVGNEVSKDGAVEQVPLPDPLGLSRTEQPAGHPVRDEQLCITDGQRQALAEYRLSSAAPLGRRLGISVD